MIIEVFLIHPHPSFLEPPTRDKDFTVLWLAAYISDDCGMWSYLRDPSSLGGHQGLSPFPRQEDKDEG